MNSLNQKQSAKYDIPMDKARMLRKNGATRAYTYQRRNAKMRGIDWQFTLDTWWDVWSSSGRWELRGRGMGKFVMARRGDTGPYSPSNVYICTFSENSKEMQALRKQLKCSEI